MPSPGPQTQRSGAAPARLQRRLVLWDVDSTLLDPAGFGRDAMHAAFEHLFGTPVTTPVHFAGRTDKAIVREFLGHLDSDHLDRSDYADAFQDLAAAIAEEQRHTFLAGGGHVLPGAAEALAALADLPDVVQSVLTGNMRRIGLVKLGAAGLTDRLDLDVAAFGDEHLVRADLVDVARGLAERKYGVEFPAESVVIVGDTPLDVEAALARGATAVGVATGSFSEAELAASGAHTVLPDLTNTPRLLAAIRAAAPRS
ncbi:phosphoglycolate phosphatase [Streptacidiphilus sp. MAP12-16]|uniref:HAD hydrolase-like protein n=1 Tax=Streptacidiphilus sp. MAP12-16 TaxID=3156300 RepID=UPI0035194FA8